MPQASDSTVWMSIGLPLAGILTAVLGAWCVRRRDVKKRPRATALFGSGTGLAAVSGGFACYFGPVVPANEERIELYMAVFIGALIFAVSTIAFCGVRNPSNTIPDGRRRGDVLVNLTALALCGWLGYGFVTEYAQPYGLAALLAMSTLAAALGVHWMLTGSHGRHARASTAAACRPCNRSHVRDSQRYRATRRYS